MMMYRFASWGTDRTCHLPNGCMSASPHEDLESVKYLYLSHWPDWQLAVRLVCLLDFTQLFALSLSVSVSPSLSLSIGQCQCQPEILLLLLVSSLVLQL